MNGPLTVRPDVWNQVDPNTVGALVDQIHAILKDTTPASGMAAAITALSFIITDHYPPDQWGPLAYDTSLFTSDALIREFVTRMQAARQTAEPPTQDVVVDPPPPVPPAPLPSKFSAGVGRAPGATEPVEQ